MDYEWGKKFVVILVDDPSEIHSDRISDSIHFMHYQSEFQCDPFQDRPAARTGQEWVELETWPFGALRETFFPARW